VLFLWLLKSSHALWPILGMHHAPLNGNTTFILIKTEKEYYKPCRTDCVEGSILMRSYYAYIIQFTAIDSLYVLNQIKQSEII